MSETTRSPRFLENPCARAAFLDPGGSAMPGHSGRALLIDIALLPSAASNGVGSHDAHLSGLTRTTHALAVYASQLGIAPDPRKTRFRLVARLGRTGLSPVGLLRKVWLC